MLPIFKLPLVVRCSVKTYATILKELHSTCGKVIFSQACVKNSVHGGVGMPQCMLGYTHPWTDTPLDRHPQGRQPPVKHHPPTATVADGTHSTGMRSCFIFTFFHFDQFPLLGNFYTSLYHESAFLSVLKLTILCTDLGCACFPQIFTFFT